MTINVPWTSGTWTTQPAATREADGRLLVTAVEGSDAWRRTCYGFVHDDEHALLADWSREQAVEVTVKADFTEQFDQAGLFVRVAAERWIKAGLEFADGALGLGAVVTDGYSDWSSTPVPDWAGREVTVRASRIGDAVAVRARVEDEPWRLIRLTPLAPSARTQAGPYCCAPTRAGLTLEFASWRLTEPDAALH
ncbi:DUF1349 domain-containing protein [Streptomyces beihaiensis]|uniref:DUF1349 domain-containing protein n=1 Tax=Streptomyces beihaiensis TaxID=2984495 RepID=A0ABT3TX91_9ACTN|nr:DUF1349 domain-containing protein [Streptomyces beihaiensis]MCX3061667.1 DUF1349 domain-containing protein [Streptomyces beihaiensis]